MTYYDDKTKEFMVAVLHNDECPCLPIYECIEDQSVAKEINTYVTKINQENKKYKELLPKLIDTIISLKKLT